MMTVNSLGVLMSTSKVMPLGTRTESPSLGRASPPQVLCTDHRSMYRKGLAAKMTGLPSEIMMKELPADGGVALNPVVQETEVAVLLLIMQGIPSIVMVITVPKFNP
jgi:hypothetical protein